MAINKRVETPASLTLTTPTAIATGDPVVLQGADRAALGRQRGKALVANQSAQELAGGITTTFAQISFDAWGAFLLPVVAKSSESPDVNSAIQAGDPIFANINTGTYDATSGIWYGFTLDNNQSGCFFGIALDPVIAGATTSIRVLLGGVNG